MRAIGVAERAMALMIDRVNTRIAFGKPLADQGVVQQQVAQSRNEIEQSRMLCHKAAWVIDSNGNKSKDAQQLVAMIKAVGTADGVQRHRPRDPGARCRGCQRRHRACPSLRLAPGDAAVRRPGRGAHATIARAELGREKSAFAAAVTS